MGVGGWGGHRGGGGGMAPEGSQGFIYVGLGFHQQGGWGGIAWEGSGGEEGGAHGRGVVEWGTGGIMTAGIRSVWVTLDRMCMCMCMYVTPCMTVPPCMCVCDPLLVRVCVRVCVPGGGGQDADGTPEDGDEVALRLALAQDDGASEPPGGRPGHLEQPGAQQPQQPQQRRTSRQHAAGTMGAGGATWAGRGSSSPDVRGLGPGRGLADPAGVSPGGGGLGGGLGGAAAAAAGGSGAAATEDIVAMLIGVFGSKDIFVNEYR